MLTDYEDHISAFEIYLLRYIYRNDVIKIRNDDYQNSQ